MFSQSTQLITGPSGQLETLLTTTQSTPRALALICHPHPQHGGSMDNKVVQTLAKAFQELNCAVMRFNFRGVGKSDGEFDNGIGETEDAAAALDAARSQLGNALPLIAAGFSFGCYVQTRLYERAKPQQLVLVGPAVKRFEIPAVAKDTLVVHGEEDDVVPLADVMDWARPQALPVTIFPGAGHFFHGRLTELKACVKRHCANVGA